MTPIPVIRATRMPFEPKQVQFAISLNTFNAQEAGTYSNADLTILWNHVLFPKYSNTKMKLLGDAISLDS